MKIEASMSLDELRLQMDEESQADDYVEKLRDLLVEQHDGKDTSSVAGFLIIHDQAVAIVNDQRRSDLADEFITSGGSQ